MKQFSKDWEQWHIFIGSLVKVSLPGSVHVLVQHQFYLPSVTTEDSPTTILPAYLTYGEHHAQSWRYQGEFQSGKKRGGNWSKGNAFRKQGLAHAGWRDGSGADREGVGMWFPSLAWALFHAYRIAMAKIQGQSILLIFVSILNKKKYWQTLCFM